LPITANRLREATRGDPVFSRVLHFVLHGWPAEESTPEELWFCGAKREEFTVEDGCLLRGTRVVIASRYLQKVLSEGLCGIGMRILWQDCMSGGQI